MDAHQIDREEIRRPPARETVAGDAVVLVQDVSKVIRTRAVQTVILVGIGLLFLAWRDPARQRKLTIFGIVVLALAIVRIVVILV